MIDTQVELHVNLCILANVSLTRGCPTTRLRDLVLSVEIPTWHRQWIWKIDNGRANSIESRRDSIVWRMVIFKIAQDSLLPSEAASQRGTASSPGTPERVVVLRLQGARFY